jgi:hypothetical protein
MMVPDDCTRTNVCYKIDISVVLRTSTADDTADEGGSLCAPACDGWLLPTHARNSPACWPMNVVGQKEPIAGT